MIRNLETRLAALEGGATPKDCQGGWQFIAIKEGDTLPEYDPVCIHCGHLASEHTAPGKLPVVIVEVVVRSRAECDA
jgi:hypothetical protein